MPDLPQANYNVWVRGYGLVDSPKVQGDARQELNLTAVVAPNPHAAARILSGRLLVLADQVPAKSEFPGTGPTGNGIAANMKSQASGSRNFKIGRLHPCHQLGNKGTREIPASARHVSLLGRRLGAPRQSGQAGAQMSNGLNSFGRAARARRCSPTGPTASPPAKCRRRRRGRKASSATSSSPQWDWADPKAYLHDEVSTDRRNPTVNANGPIYGSLELSADYLPVLDPVRHTSEPGAVDGPRSEHAADVAGDAGSRRRTGATKPIWTSKTNVHNPMFDEQGPRLDHLRGAAAGQSGFLRAGLEPSVGEAVPARQRVGAISRSTIRRRRSSRTSAPASARTT